MPRPAGSADCDVAPRRSHRYRSVNILHPGCQILVPEAVFHLIVSGGASQVTGRTRRPTHSGENRFVLTQIVAIQL